MTDTYAVKITTIGEPSKKKGGKRPGAGRPSLVRENIEREKQGLLPITNPAKKKIYKRKSNAILPADKRKRSQEILAEMLGRKSTQIVQRVIDKALDDEDEDQMACLKLVLDRVLPADYLSKNKQEGNKIEINITGVGQANVSEIIDAELVEEEDV